MNFWLVKQEPEKFSFDDFLREGATDWTGVRNFQARQNLQRMKTGDRVLFYHSVTEKRIVGAARVSAEAFQDSTDETGKWVAVRLEPLEKFATPVDLNEIKNHEKLKDIALVRQTRLSVLPLTREEYETICRMAE